MIKGFFKTIEISEQVHLQNLIDIFKKMQIYGHEILCLNRLLPFLNDKSTVSNSKLPMGIFTPCPHLANTIKLW